MECTTANTTTANTSSSAQAAPQRRSQRLTNTGGNSTQQQQQDVLDDSDVSPSASSSSTPSPLDATIADDAVIGGHAAALDLMGNTVAAAITAPQDALVASVVDAAAVVSAGATIGEVNPRIAESAVVRGLRQKMAEESITLAAVGSTLGQSAVYVDEVFQGQREATEEDLARLATFFGKSLRVLKYLFLGRDWL